MQPYNWYRADYVIMWCLCIVLVVSAHFAIVARALDWGVWRQTRDSLLPLTSSRKRSAPLMVNGIVHWQRTCKRLIGPLVVCWFLIAASAFASMGLWNLVTYPKFLVKQTQLLDPHKSDCSLQVLQSCDMIGPERENIIGIITSSSEQALFGQFFHQPIHLLEQALTSFRAVNPEADIFVQTDDPIAALECAKAFSGVYIVYLGVWWLPNLGGTRLLSPAVFRYVAFSLIFEDLGLRAMYDSVLLMDLSDVLFQSDPFAAVADQTGFTTPGLHAFLEQRATTLTYPDINAQWVGQCFGNAALHSMWGAPVSCSGTTLATMDAAIEYAELQSTLARSSPWCARHGNDQGIHNYIVHTGAVQPTVMHTLEQGPIMTLDRVDHLVFDGATGALVNDDGVPYAVVHQLRRCGRFLEGGGVVQEVGSDGVRRRSTRWGCNTLHRTEQRPGS